MLAAAEELARQCRGPADMYERRINGVATVI